MSDARFFAYCPECNTVLADDVSQEASADAASEHCGTECGVAITGQMQDKQEQVQVFREAYIER